MMTPAPDLAALLDPVCAIAGGAGRVVLRLRNQSMKIQPKADGSPSTAADEASEAHIVKMLRLLTPSYPIIAEEEVSRGVAVDIANKPFWLIDPLDATRDFIAGEAEFCINIALIIDNQPVLGAIYAPALDEMYFGAQGVGVFCQKGIRPPDPISGRIANDTRMSVISSRHHGDEAGLSAYLSNLPIKQHKRMSSALKFCEVAAGRADLYPRFGRAMAWDVAAGHALVVLAGGTVTTVNGQPLQYRTPDFQISNFIARTRFSG